MVLYEAVLSFKICLHRLSGSFNEGISVSFAEVESQEVSDAESGSGSEGGDSSAGSGSESDDNQSQSTQDASDNFSVTDSTPEKRKGAEATGNEPKRRKIVDDNMLRVPLAEG